MAFKKWVWFEENGLACLPTSYGADLVQLISGRLVQTGTWGGNFEWKTVNMHKKKFGQATIIKKSFHHGTSIKRN